jgi:hypothetical protein
MASRFDAPQMDFDTSGVSRRRRRNFAAFLAVQRHVEGYLAPDASGLSGCRRDTMIGDELENAHGRPRTSTPTSFSTRRPRPDAAEVRRTRRQQVNGTRRPAASTKPPGACRDLGERGPDDAKLDVWLDDPHKAGAEHERRQIPATTSSQIGPQHDKIGSRADLASKSVSPA